MLSSVAAYWTVFVEIILCCEGVHSLNVIVSSVIFIGLNATNLTLPCEYVLENPDHACNIRWEKRGDLVIVKDSAGQTFAGDRYLKRVLWGFNCSLILLYPGKNDMGKYTFTAFAPDDRKDTESVSTYVINRRATKSSRETTSGVCPATSVSQSIDPNTVAAEDGYTSSAWVTSGLVIAIAVIFLVAHGVVMWWTERHRFTDIKHRLPLGGLFVVLTTGIIAGIVGMALKSPVVTVVGQCFFCLGIVSDIFCVVWVIKTKAFVWGQFTRSSLNDGPSTENNIIPDESEVGLSLDSGENQHR